MKKNKKDKKSFSARARLTLGFVLSAALILLSAMGTIFLVEFAIVLPDIAERETLESSFLFWIIMFLVASIVVGLALYLILGQVVLKPVNKVLDGMERLADGDYKVRIKPGKMDGMKDLSKRFNSLATELENTEMLRADFVNNFSHELKTPIVSINGLVAIMKKGKVPPEKQKEYLLVIEEETNRLTALTTNILNLSKVENQEILTNKTKFNISEQLRSCLLLTERKWAKKKLKPVIDIEECEVLANEDMLKQVWYNLIDNAIKFSEEKKELKIELVESEKSVSITVENTGETIAPEDMGKIFNKFYRGVRSSKSDGSGIGLSIVKHIVDLHEGEIKVDSADGKTAFTVTLPKK